MANMRLKLENVTEFLRLTEKLGKEYQRSELAPILLSGARIMQNGVLLFAPIRSGQLADSINVKLSERSNQAAAIMFADTSKLSRRDKSGKVVRYPYMVEYGAAAHAIGTRKGSLRTQDGQFLGRAVMHPGFTGAHYFSRGVDFSKREAKRRIEAALVAKIRTYQPEQVTE